MRLFNSSRFPNCDVTWIKGNRSHSTWSSFNNIFGQCNHGIYHCTDDIIIIWGASGANFENSFWTIDFKTKNCKMHSYHNDLELELKLELEFTMCTMCTMCPMCPSLRNAFVCHLICFNPKWIILWINVSHFAHPP